jgi:hypothetical protein
MWDAISVWRALRILSLRPAGHFLGPFPEAFHLGGQSFCKGRSMLDAASKWHGVALYRVPTAFHFDDPAEALFDGRLCKIRQLDIVGSTLRKQSMMALNRSAT